MSKEKPKNYKHMKKKEPTEGEEERTTIFAFPEIRTHQPMQTTTPMLKKQPQWIYRSGAGAINTSLGVGIILNPVWWVWRI